jgi:hypothetical protein
MFPQAHVGALAVAYLGALAIAYSLVVMHRTKLDQTIVPNGTLVGYLDKTLFKIKI